MFKKRKVPAGDSATLLKNETNESDGEDVVGIVKRNRQATDEDTTRESKSNASPKEPEILDGIALEEEADIVAAKRNEAVVDVDSSNNQKPKKTSKFGPASAPVYMRATTIVDYKPDLCKDYNETGYCGYGDACIYLHDRTTYVSGNILDKRWDDMMKKKSQEKAKGGLEKTDDEEQCLICNNVLRPPIIRTRCGHRFCRSCALSRFDKLPTCATCGAQTMGIFNEVRT